MVQTPLALPDKPKSSRAYTAHVICATAIATLNNYDRRNVLAFGARQVIVLPFANNF